VLGYLKQVTTVSPIKQHYKIIYVLLRKTCALNIGNVYEKIHKQLTTTNGALPNVPQKAKYLFLFFGYFFAKPDEHARDQTHIFVKNGKKTHDQQFLSLPARALQPNRWDSHALYKTDLKLPVQYNQHALARPLSMQEVQYEQSRYHY
jgi:hypothetical protein